MKSYLTKTPLKIERSVLSFNSRLSGLLCLILVFPLRAIADSESTELDSLHVEQAVSVPVEVLMFLVAVALLIFFWDFFDRQSSSLGKKVGLEKGSKILELKDSGRDNHESDGVLYCSKSLIKSQPDALISEDGHTIPVDIVPTSSKVQDRHVVKILTHLFLLEKTSGIRPPYGILRMGKKGRIVRISNTEEKQEWLAGLIKEMREIEAGSKEAKADPTKKKCQYCEVEKTCSFSAAPK